jgi:mitochondrial import receptor subunit TOM40
MTNGDVMAQYVLQATPNLTVRAQSQLTSVEHQSNAVVNVDYKGTDWYGQAKIGSYAQWGLSYLQSVSNNLALGVDFTYLGRPPFNQPPVCVSTMAMRYSTDTVALVAQLTSNARLQTSYIRRIQDSATFAAEINVDLESRESVCALGYEYTSSQGSLKTNITTDGKITTLLEKPLSELSAINFSAELDHKAKACKYGISVQFLQ